MGSTERWICCQIGAREHYAVARALHQRQALDLLIADVWVRPRNPLGAIKPNLRSRFHPELATASVHAPTFSGIRFELQAKRAGLREWSLIVARNRWFQKAAVSRLGRVVRDGKRRVLMAYSYAALEIIRYARARGWRTILGQIDPGPPEERIVAKLYDKAPEQASRWQPAPDRYWSDWREECALADRIVVNSDWSRTALVEEGVPPEKLKVVPLAYEQPKSSDFAAREYPPTFTPDRPLRVLFLGQINLRKGIGPLFEAITILRSETIEFTFVGPIQLSIPADITKNPNVHFVGPVPRERTAPFYRDADVFILPTFSDGFAMTQLEAQFWKLPVIATKSCGEVVEHGTNGWLLPEISSAAIVLLLRRCLEPAELRALSARCMCNRRFSLDSVGTEWLSAFE
jgi:glycosyltransferase involved in cell wall biosynthesis